MLADPGQTRDVARKNQDVYQELTAAVRRWKAEVLEPNQSTDRPFSVGHLDFGLTQLPARDAKFSDSIARSATAPNCSYLKAWVSDDQQISWDIEVLTAGTYEVVMHYACDESIVGVRVVAEAGNVRAAKEILSAHTPPAVGPAFDRVPRITQSPMKEFAPLRIGTLKLPVGRTTLKLTGRGFPPAQDAEDVLSDKGSRDETSEKGAETSILERLDSSETNGLEMRLLMLRRVRD
jgi:hypothetical protein